MTPLRFMSKTLTIARREFASTVYQPGFVVFLLSPLLLLAFSLIGGSSVDSAMSSNLSQRQVLLIIPSDRTDIIRAADMRLQAVLDEKERPTLLFAVPSNDAPDQIRRMMDAPGNRIMAALYGNLERPVIVHAPTGERDARYLIQLTELALQMETHGQTVETITPTVRADLRTHIPAQAIPLLSEGVAALSIVLVFLATYVLSSHISNSFAEERSSKIIEILASSVPVESIFFGKILGELSIAALFMGFWIVVIGAAISVGGLATLPMEGGASSVNLLATGTGSLFPVLVFAYFLMAYLISSCTILGLASLASTPRGSAIMVMPFAIVQFSMMSLATYGAMHPGTPGFYLALAIPYSSPLVMVGQAATSPSLVQHGMALTWQAFCFIVIMKLASKSFRRGALGAGGNWSIRPASAAS